MQQTHLEEIYYKVVEKAEFLIKLEPTKTEVANLRIEETLSRKPSYVKSTASSEFSRGN